jgi:hypothetical protein
MPLKKVEHLADIFIERGYIVPSRCAWRRAEFRERAELLVMSTLYILGRGAAFCSCRALCHISTLAICKFFFKFLDALMDMCEEYIKLPGNVVELNHMTVLYASVGLPGACGLMDVVHIKWLSCPAGDYNQAKGKEGYLTLGFQVITDFNRCILGVNGPQFRTANNKHIMKMDSNVKKILLGRFKDIWWHYYMEDGCIRHKRGVYLICDNGYLHWPSSIVHMRVTNALLRRGISPRTSRVFARTLSAPLEL